MNSLSYITRRLDHSSSFERLPHRDLSDSEHSSSQLRRSETWSKPLYFRRRTSKRSIVTRDSSDDSSEDTSDSQLTLTTRPSHVRAKRSFSSPALLKGSSATPPSNSPLYTSSNFVSIPSNNSVILSAQPTLTLEAIPPSLLVHKENFLVRRLRRLSLVRAIVLVWNTICAAYDRIIPYHYYSKQVCSRSHVRG